MPTDPRPNRPPAPRPNADVGSTIAAAGGSSGSLPAAVTKGATAPLGDTPPQAASGRTPALPLGTPPATPPEVVDGMKVLRLLGWGGMGWVLEVEEPKLLRRVAVKMMLPAVAAQKIYRERFLREAQAQARVEHKYIVPIYSFHDTDPPYLIMPLLQGKSLDRRMNERKAEGKPLRVAEAAQIAAKLATALAAVHASGLIHRDIKPSNVWLEGERARLLDFGVARVAESESDLTRVGDLVGTPKYMSPEQALGDARVNPVDHRADLYSLGAVLYEMLTMRLPFPGENVAQIVAAHHTHTPERVEKLNPRVPPALADLIHGLLVPDANRRTPTTADAVLTRLKILLAAGGRALSDPPNPSGVTSADPENDAVANSDAAPSPPPAPKPRLRSGLVELPPANPVPPPDPAVPPFAPLPKVHQALSNSAIRASRRVPRNVLVFAALGVLMLATMIGVVWAIAATRPPAASPPAETK
jgi:serine/threonine protein kinase